MRKITFLVIAGLAVTPIGYAQVNRSDSQTLQAILSELREIRSELHNQQAQNQTMQVLLFQMQTYQTTINRATQRTDDARSNLAEVREGERHFSDDIGRDEDSLQEAQDEAERKRLASDIDGSKASLASFKTMEQDRITVLQQAEAQLQKAEESFDAVQNQVGQLLKAPR
jgi:Tfp pilus assembly protein PilO